MLGTYFAIILVLFIALIVAAVVGYNMKFDGIETNLRKTMKSYTATEGDSKTTKAWDKIQKDVSLHSTQTWSKCVICQSLTTLLPVQMLRCDKL